MVPDAGRVRLSGKDVTDWPLHRRAREGGMGYLAQESSVFRKLTVEQNLLGVMEMMGMPGRERRVRCEELLQQLSITHIRKSLAEPLSGGEKRRLEIARCLIHRPRIIMLDEPFAGIDPVTVQQIQGIIADLKTQGISVWITDHAAREILQTVGRVYVVIAGEVVVEGPPETVRTHPRVREAYLGNVADDAGPIAVPSAADRVVDPPIHAPTHPVTHSVTHPSIHPPTEVIPADRDSGPAFTARRERFGRLAGGAEPVATGADPGPSVPGPSPASVLPFRRPAGAAGSGVAESSAAATSRVRVLRRRLLDEESFAPGE